MDAGSLEALGRTDAALYVHILHGSNSLFILAAHRGALKAKGNLDFRVDAYVPDDAIVERAKRSTEADPNYNFFQKYIALRELLTKQISPEKTPTSSDSQREFIRFMRAYSLYEAGKITKEELQAEYGRSY